MSRVKRMKHVSFILVVVLLDTCVCFVHSAWSLLLCANVNHSYQICFGCTMNTFHFSAACVFAWLLHNYLPATWRLWNVKFARALVPNLPSSSQMLTLINIWISVINWVIPYVSSKRDERERERERERESEVVALLLLHMVHFCSYLWNQCFIHQYVL